MLLFNRPQRKFQHRGRHGLEKEPQIGLRATLSTIPGMTLDQEPVTKGDQLGLSVELSLLIHGICF
jgi:hypothetical protein